MPLTIKEASNISGFIGACVVDGDSGLMLASEGGGDRLDLNMVAALNSDFVKAKQTAIEQLGLRQNIEDILITLDELFDGGLLGFDEVAVQRGNHVEVKPVATAPPPSGSRSE